jgi:hypothetical protein
MDAATAVDDLDPAMMTDEPNPEPITAEAGSPSEHDPAG